MIPKAVILFRPVGQREFELISESGFTEFPPRLEGQPIFYPVLSEEYATYIAREWNTTDTISGYVGYVLRFAVQADFLAYFEIRKVGSATALEYWIPAAQLKALNANIIGMIELIARFE